ncbi:hypothetical protein THTE_3552 [Thermogutta terrifontis]|uniref:Uncharacterized protein n=1 Tax=Thermogutta terrifontis TaxID=1331910 RepID=A0A286RJL8_9BACT|nr:hypothetical protein [Thermogutta terrifontis]ASV76153.1 hypothetical protein THTE_3552 [Thermogutta terrifontis]
MAECELGCLTRQCLAGRRLEELRLLQEQIAAWSADLNARQRGVDRQMTAEDVRRKLKSVYSKIIL